MLGTGEKTIFVTKILPFEVCVRAWVTVICPQ
jgi:hypothetical protein